MNRLNREELLNAGLKRKLTPSEETQLQLEFEGGSGGLTELEEELKLNQLLRQLPNAPLSSNFTAQIVRAVEREQRSTEPSPSPSLSWRNWIFSNGLRKAVFAAVAISLTLLTYRQYQISERHEFARSVAAVSDVAILPSVDVLQDFDAIRRLDSGAPLVDFELLAALDLDK